MGDSDKIESVFSNLIQNAIEASHPGGTISVETMCAPKSVKIIISDEGIGMLPDVRDKIFQPFFTTKEHGTGIGLLVVESNVKSHGGTIELESELGKGTTFTITFPSL
jgi:signal transduction histidine kinase